MFLILSKIGSGILLQNQQEIVFQFRNITSRNRFRKVVIIYRFCILIYLYSFGHDCRSKTLYLLFDASPQIQSSTICEVLCNVWPVLLTRCSKEERLLVVVVVSTALAIARISGEPLLHCAAASTILGVTLAFLWTLQWFKHKKKNMTQLLKSLELFGKSC